jgi:TonB family protein
MGQLDLLTNARAAKGQPHRLRAFLASCAFHGFALGLILGLAFLYRSQMSPPKSGSAPGAPSISLEKITIVSPPPKPAPAVGSNPAVRAIPSLPTPAPAIVATTPPRAPEAKPVPPEATVPVLAVQPVRPMQTTPSKTPVAIHPPISHSPIATTQSSQKPAAAASVSSYAPGPSVLPHPPYPLEARDHGQTGTVVMNIQFDAQGNVAQAEVAQSSGVPILDSETRSFIRAHWHSAAYASQTISQPVQYSLENL